MAHAMRHKTENIADVSMEEYLDQADLSDQEDAEQIHLSPFHVDWLDLTQMGCSAELGISGLPGCRYRDNWRSLAYDLDCLKEMDVVEVFSLCTEGELYRCRVKNLMEKLREAGFSAHQYSIEDGLVPEICELMKLIEEIRVALVSGRKTVIHCQGDGGRSCVVVICLLMVLDENLNQEDAIEKVKKMRNKPALQSVKQYNFVNGFKEVFEEYHRHGNGTESRSLSR